MMTYHQGQKGRQAYRETAILAASPEQLVVLLYEHLIINLKRADRHIRHQEFEGKAEALTRAREIVMELLSSLDFDQGGEIAGRLASLYAFFVQEIGEVGRTLDTERIGKLVGMAEELHEAWAQAAQAPGGGPDEAVAEPA